MKWALIEAPVPNSPSGKYISQIPSPNNLLTVASALMCIGVPKEEIKLYNFLKERHPPIIKAKNIVFNMGEIITMDYLYNYAHIYLDKLTIANLDSNIFLTGYHTWLHPHIKKNYLFNTDIHNTTPHYFENDILQSLPEIMGKHTDPKTEWHNAWELNDWDFMNANVHSVTKGIRCTIRASRGCPFKCRMCAIPQIYKQKVVRNSVEWVIEEIDTLYHKYNIRQFGFLDDNLMVNKKWGKELLNRMIENNYKGASFTFEEGLDVPTACDEELLILLKKARFTHIKLGVESFNPATLKFINKPYKDPKKAIRAIELLKKHKLNPICFICIGFPTDTEASLKETIDKLIELKVKLRVQILWSYPGVNFADKGLSRKKLKEIQCNAMYGTNSVAWRRKKV